MNTWEIYCENCDEPIEIWFSYTPPERPTRYYPGAPADVEILDADGGSYLTEVTCEHCGHKKEFTDEELDELEEKISLYAGEE